MPDSEQKNGYVRWWQLSISSISLLAIMVTIALFAANQAIAIDERSNMRDKDMLALVLKDNEKVMEAIQSISLDVRELKTKMGGTNHDPVQPSLRVS